MDDICTKAIKALCVEVGLRQSLVEKGKENDCHFLTKFKLVGELQRIRLPSQIAMCR